MSGIHKTDFQTFMVRNLDSEGRFTFNSLAFFQRYHRLEDQPFDELGVQGIVFWNLNRNFSVGPGLYYNHPKGFMPKVAFQTFHKTGKLTVITNPGLYYHEDGFWGGELFGQLSLLHSFREGWSAAVTASVLTTWDRFRDHGRSFLQFRAGPRLPSGVQFGLAYDHDWYSPAKLSRRSLGLYVQQQF